MPNCVPNSKSYGNILVNHSSSWNYRMEGRWKLAQFLACSFLSLTKPFFPHPLSCHLPAGVSSYIPSLHPSINPPPPPVPFSSPSHHQPHPFTLYGLLPLPYITILSIKESPAGWFSSQSMIISYLFHSIHPCHHPLFSHILHPEYT